MPVTPAMAVMVVMMTAEPLAEVHHRGLRYRGCFLHHKGSL